MDVYAVSIEVSTNIAFMHKRFYTRSFVLACLHGTARQHHDSQKHGMDEQVQFLATSLICFSLLKNAYRQGNTNSVNAVEDASPPTTTVASGR